MLRKILKTIFGFVALGSGVYGFKTDGFEKYFFQTVAQYHVEKKIPFAHEAFSLELYNEFVNHEAKEYFRNCIQTHLKYEESKVKINKKGLQLIQEQVQKREAVIDNVSNGHDAWKASGPYSSKIDDTTIEEEDEQRQEEKLIKFLQENPGKGTLAQFPQDYFVKGLDENDLQFYNLEFLKAQPMKLLKQDEISFKEALDLSQTNVHWYKKAIYDMGFFNLGEIIDGFVDQNEQIKNLDPNDQ